MKPDPWKFNYHDTRHDQDFLRWLMIAAVPAQDREVFNRLEEITDGFQQVELGMTINGVPVNTESVLNYFRRLLESRAERRAEEVVDEILAPFRGLIARLVDLNADFTEAVRKEFLKAGIELRMFEADQ